MISFVMLTWNRKEFVRKCLDSFFENVSGEYDYTLNVIDNGSDDGTGQLLDQYANMHDRLQVCHNRKNKGLREYKRLLNGAKGDHIVVIDDDVLEFPHNFDKIMVDYLNVADNFGFLALDVVQNKYTNGAKPEQKHYSDLRVRDKIISEGPTGGWCAILRKKDFDRIKIRFNIGKMNMSRSEDARIAWLMRSKLGLRSGIIKDVKCLHACGEYYSKKYGYLERDKQKYREAGLDEFVKKYEEIN